MERYYFANCPRMRSALDGRQYVLVMRDGETYLSPAKELFKAATLKDVLKAAGNTDSVSGNTEAKHSSTSNNSNPLSAT